MNGQNIIVKHTTVQERVQAISCQDNLNLYTMPTSAKIEISGICSLQCNFCFQQQLRKQNIRQKLMGIDDFLLVIKYLQSIKTITEVGLFLLGESTLNSNLSLYYRLLKEKQYFTFLTTNGTKLDTLIQALPFIDSVKVSWNYVDVYDFVKKTNQSAAVFNQIQQNINTLYNEVHKHNKELTISTVLDRPKAEYKDILKTLKYDHHYWIPLQTQCGYNNIGIDGVVGEDQQMRKQLPCWSLFKSVYVDVDLNVRSCCYGHYDKHILYNLHNTPSFKFTDEYLLMRSKQLNMKIPVQCKECLRSL